MPPMVERRSGCRIADRVATVTGLVLVVSAALGSLWFSTVFGIAADICVPGACDDSILVWAYLVTWGGAGVGVILAVVGTVVATRRARPRWPWPTVALILVVVSLVVGSSLADTVLQRS